MQIDPRIEQPMRNALSAVVKRNEALFDQEMRQGFFQFDEAARRDTLAIVMLIGACALEQIYSGKPSASQIQVLAAELADIHQWTGLTEDDFISVLTVLAGSSKPAVDPESGVVLCFVTTASLLSGGAPPGIQWWEFLDRAEAAIEELS